MMIRWNLRSFLLPLTRRVVQESSDRTAQNNHERLHFRSIANFFIQSHKCHLGGSISGFLKSGISWMTGAAMLTVSCLSPTSSSNAEVNAVVSRADNLYESRDWKVLYEHLLLYKDSNFPEILWRLARAARDVSQLDDIPKERKKALVYEALDYIRRATKLSPDNFACQKWSGILLSDVGDYEGNKVKISNAYIIKEHFAKAIKLNPTDATSRHLLGLWCFTFADMPWYQRKAAAAFFTTPPSSTYEEALEHFSKAEEMDPDFYCSNQLMLGKTQLRLGHKEQARTWLEKTLQYRTYKPEDKQAQEEAKRLLRTLPKTK